MAITISVAWTDATDNDGGSTAAVTLAGVTTGRSVLLCVRWLNASATISSITCPGETVVLKTKATQAAASANVQWGYVDSIVAGGSKTFTVNFSAGTFHVGVGACEITGALTSGIYDAENQANNSGSANPSVGVTTTTDGAAIFAGVFSNNTNAHTAGSGYTLITFGQTTGSAEGEYDLDVGAAGAKTVDFTASSQAWALSAIAIKADPNFSITPDVGSLSFTGYAPTVTTPFLITPSVGALAFTGYAPTVSNSTSPTITPDVGSLAFTGYAPTASVSGVTSITPSVGALAFTGYAPTLVQTVYDAVFTLPLRTLDAYGTGGFDAILRLPLRTIDAYGYTGNVGTVEFTSPLRTLVASGNEGGAFDLPLRTIDAAGVMGSIGVSTFTLPLRTLDADGVVSIFASASFQLLLRSLSASGIHGVIATTEFTTPLRTLEAQGYAGIIATSSFDLLLRTLEARGYPQLTGTAAFTLPLRYLDASVLAAVAQNYRAWVVNTRTGAMTEYGNFNFNSIVRFGERYLASGPNGLFVLGGEDDYGTDISALIRTGLNDYGNSMLKRIPRIYVSGEFDDDVLFSTISTEDGKRTYRLVDNEVTGEQQRRVPVGRGPKSARWQLEVQNVDGGKMGISKILVYTQTLRRRIQ
jgi:hypothetical protein